MLDGGQRFPASQANVAHVADVKDADSGAHRHVLGHDAATDRRVVRHEAGHTLGFPHEHMRRALVNKIDRRKAIAYFQRMDGWTARETLDQVLTPIEEAAIRGTLADPKSIM